MSTLFSFEGSLSHLNLEMYLQSINKFSSFLENLQQESAINISDSELIDGISRAISFLVTLFEQRSLSRDLLSEYTSKLQTGLRLIPKSTKSSTTTLIELFKSFSHLWVKKIIVWFLSKIDTSHLEPHIVSQLTEFEPAQLIEILKACLTQNISEQRLVQNFQLESLVLFKLSFACSNLRLSQYLDLFELLQHYKTKMSTLLKEQTSALIDSSISNIFREFQDNQLTDPGA